MTCHAGGSHDSIEYLIGHTATPVAQRALPCDLVEEIAYHFQRTVIAAPLSLVQKYKPSPKRRRQL